MENIKTDDNDEQPLNKTAKKIFIPAIGSLGDVKPYMVLAKELSKRGHYVWLGVHPRFKEQIEASGLNTVEIGGDMALTLSTSPEGIEIQRNPSMFKMNLIKRVFLGLMEQWFQGILNGINDADLIVLSATSVLAGLSCLEKFPNTRAVAIYTFPCIRTSEFSPPALGGGSTSVFRWINSLKWKIFAYGASNIYGDAINQFRARIGLPPIKLDYDYMIQSIFKKPMNTATIYSTSLISRPADWLPTDTMVGSIMIAEETTYEPPLDLKSFLERGASDQRIIYVGIGSMMGMMFSSDEQNQFLRYVQTAIENNACRAIVSLVGFQNLDGTNVSSTEKIFYVGDNIDHNWLFPRMSAAVHHGGAGTMHTALQYGLPTLIIPFGADQPFNADRVFINRLGPKPIPARQITARNLTAAIESLLNNYETYRSNAQKISVTINNEDGLNRCIELIEQQFRF